MDFEALCLCWKSVAIQQDVGIFQQYWNPPLKEDNARRRRTDARE